MLRYISALAILISSTVEINAQESTWSRIQGEILNNNCIVCHYAESSFARQSGLVLTQDVAYANLIDVVAKNLSAAGDGLVRVSSESGMMGLEKSFLWEKVNAPDQLHFFGGHPNYGAIMPLGLPFLTNGKLAFLRAWIEAGAPNAGIVADTMLLADTFRYEFPEFVALDPPVNGFQFHLGPYDIWSENLYDREFLYYEPFETAEDLYVNAYEISMRRWSHHFIMYNYPKGKAVPSSPQTYRDIRDSTGVLKTFILGQLNGLFPLFFFVGTQTPFINYHLPPDVALLLPAGSGFDLNSHSVNRSGETQTGEVYVNIHTVDISEVKYIAEYDNITNTNIFLPPNTITTLTFEHRFSEKRNIIQMWSHAHEHMTEFSIIGLGGAHDGELLYWTNDWQHPPILELDPPLTFAAGEGVKLVTTYNNSTDQTISYGTLSSNEMQFLFYIYYSEGITSVDRESFIPDEYALNQNYPNPFNPETTIEFYLARAGAVSLVVYNLLGQEVATLVNTGLQAGEHKVIWDASNVPSGIYFYMLKASPTSVWPVRHPGGRAGEFTKMRKMILLK